MNRLMGGVLKTVTPDANIESWIVDTSDGRFLYVELEDRETRDLACARLDRDAAMVLLAQLHFLCKEAGWLKE